MRPVSQEGRETRQNLIRPGEMSGRCGRRRSLPAHATSKAARSRRSGGRDSDTGGGGAPTCKTQHGLQWQHIPAERLLRSCAAPPLPSEYTTTAIPPHTNTAQHSTLPHSTATQHSTAHHSARLIQLVQRRLVFSRHEHEQQLGIPREGGREVRLDAAGDVSLSADTG